MGRRLCFFGGIGFVTENRRGNRVGMIFWIFFLFCWLVLICLAAEKILGKKERFFFFFLVGSVWQLKEKEEMGRDVLEIWLEKLKKS